MLRSAYILSIMASQQEKDKEDMDMDDCADSDKMGASSNEDTDSDSADSASEGEEMDEEECEKMRGEMSNEMSDLEKQFLALKEQLYYERLSQVEKKLDEVKVGLSIEYMQPLEELEDNMKNRTEVAGILRELKLKNIECQHDAEGVAAKQSYESESRMLREQLRQDVEEKLRRLEEDRNTIDSEFWNESHMKKRRFANSYVEVGPVGRDQLNLPDRRRKPVSVSGPYVVYMLREQDILEDYNAIRKASKYNESILLF